MSIKKENVLSVLNEYFEKISKEDSLNILRNKAWQMFQSKDFNEKEVFIANLLQSFKKTKKISKKPIDMIEDNTLVFIDSKFDKELSNFESIKDQIEILDLELAMQKYGLVLQNIFLNSIKKEKNAFCLLNAAFIKNASYIHVKEVIEKPVNIINVIRSKESITTSKLMINIADNAKADFYHKIINESNNTWINALVDVNLQNNSCATYIQDVENLHNIYYSDFFRANIQKNAYLKIIDIVHKSNYIKQDYQIDLNKMNAKCDLYGLGILEKNNYADFKICFNHLSQQTYSDELFKTILKDKGKCEIKSNSYIRFDATLSSSRQYNKNLLMDNTATVIAKPNLEIFTDEIEAKHGACTSNIDEEELFYLKTRGFSEKEAKELLLFGFCKDILHKIKNQQIKDRIIKRYVK